MEINASKIEDISIDKLVVYLYGELVQFKDISFLNKLKVKQSRNQLIETIYQCLSLSSYKGQFKE